MPDLPAVPGRAEAEEVRTVALPDGVVVAYAPARLDRMRAGLAPPVPQPLDAHDVAEDAWAWAAAWSDVVLRWNVLGPLRDRAGRLLVAAGVTVPVDPVCLSRLPTRFVAGVFAAVEEDDRRYAEGTLERRCRVGRAGRAGGVVIDADPDAWGVR